MSEQDVDIDWLPSVLRDQARRIGRSEGARFAEEMMEEDPGLFLETGYCPELVVACYWSEKWDSIMDDNPIMDKLEHLAGLKDGVSAFPSMVNSFATGVQAGIQNRLMKGEL